MINSRNTVSPSPSRTSSRTSSSRSRSASHEMSRTLPSSFTHRRARPLRDGSDSPSSGSSGRRSQTPSRHRQNTSLTGRVTPMQVCLIYSVKIWHFSQRQNPLLSQMGHQGRGDWRLPSQLTSLPAQGSQVQSVFSMRKVHGTDPVVMSRKNAHRMLFQSTPAQMSSWRWMIWKRSLQSMMQT